MLGAWINPHSEQQTILQKVKHRARPNLSSSQRPKRAPTRRRLRRRQRRGEPHTERGLGILLASQSCRFYIHTHAPPVLSGDAARGRPHAKGTLHIYMYSLIDRYAIYVFSQTCRFYVYIHIDGLYTKGTRAHTHRELVREWLWEPKGSFLECI